MMIRAERISEFELFHDRERCAIDHRPLFVEARGKEIEASEKNGSGRWHDSNEWVGSQIPNQIHKCRSIVRPAEQAARLRQDVIGRDDSPKPALAQFHGSLVRAVIRPGQRHEVRGIGEDPRSLPFRKSIKVMIVIHGCIRRQSGGLADDIG